MPIERHWDGDEALLEYQELLEKPGTNAEVTAHQQFVRIIERYAAMAAQSTLQLSLHAYDEAIRFKASKALVDWKFRLLELENQSDPLTELIESLASKSEDENPNVHDLAPGQEDFDSPLNSQDAGEVFEGEVVQDAPAPVSQSAVRPLSQMAGLPGAIGADLPSDAPGAGAVTSNSDVRSAETSPVPDQTTTDSISHSPDDKCNCPESPCRQRHAVTVPVVAQNAGGA